MDPSIQNSTPMPVPQQVEEPAHTQPPESRGDCLSPIIFIAILGWVIIISYIRQTTILATSIDPTSESNWYSLLGAIVYIIILGIPILPLAIFWPRPRYKAVFQTFALALGYVLILLLAFIPNPTAAQTQIFIQIVLTILYIALLLLLSRLRDSRKDFPPSGDLLQPDENSRTSRPNTKILWLAALLIGAVASYPWVANGAFGSFLDTLLALVFGLLFGLAAALLIELTLPRIWQQTAGSLWANYFVGGLSIGTSILIMVNGTAFSYGSLQLILMLILPVLGLVIMPLYQLTSPRFDRPTHESLTGETFTPALINALPIGLMIGLVAATPVMLIDPDELILMLGSESGEILSVAFRTAFSSMFIILTFAIVLLVLLLFRSVRSAPSTPSEKKSPWFLGFLGAAVLIAWVFIPLIYLSTGQPGLYGERMFVILENQADVSAALDIEDYNQRRQFVYDTLVSHANTDQAGIRSILDTFSIDYTPYYLVNAIEIEGNPLVRLWLLTRSDVDRVLESPQLRPLPDSLARTTGYGSPPRSPRWNLTMIRADSVWEAFGVTGEGIVIGQSDSGVQQDHPELASTYRGNNGTHDYNWFDPWFGTTSPTDIGGHGTHTLGSIVGQNTGVAPGATWYACVNLGRNLGNPALYLDCMQFMLAPFPLNGDPFADGDPTLGAHVINNSWGCPKVEGCDPGSLLYAVRALRSAGVFVVASAGNDGPACQTLNSPPSIYAEVFAVGAIDQGGNLASFSSIGPVTSDDSGRVKPDIVAPGVGVLSSLPGNTYDSYSGTSMAGPHVAGVVALMWAANPELIGDIDLTEQILIQTTQPYTGRLPDCPGANERPSTGVGYGIVDAYAAVQKALETAK